MVDVLSRLPDQWVLDWESASKNIRNNPAILVVIDDDPTGTQSVSDLPVLLRWDIEDFLWAFQTGCRAVYVMTNSRSLSPPNVRRITKEVVVSAIAAAEQLGKDIVFVSRSDSTLRGHFPLEPQVIADTLVTVGSTAPRRILLVPAFPDAGRITVDGIHYTGSIQEDHFVPVGESEFAQDATFGFFSSHLAQWVEEKSQGSYTEHDCAILPIGVIRQGPSATAQWLSSVSDKPIIAVDCAAETDLQVLALALDELDEWNNQNIYRVGPPFVRSFIGQSVTAPLTKQDVAKIGGSGELSSSSHGLIVVGSHTSITTAQLQKLTDAYPDIATFTIDVPSVLDSSRRERAIEDVSKRALQQLATSSVIINTSRTRIATDNDEESLDIARSVSGAVCEVVSFVLARARPTFIVAKGGITSSDIASKSLGIARAICRGSLLPGLVALWEPVDGPFQGVPYIVFPGNVGDELSLRTVVGALEG